MFELKKPIYIPQFRSIDLRGVSVLLRRGIFYRLMNGSGGHDDYIRIDQTWRNGME